MIPITVYIIIFAVVSLISTTVIQRDRQLRRTNIDAKLFAVLVFSLIVCAFIFALDRILTLIFKIMGMM